MIALRAFLQSQSRRLLIVVALGLLCAVLAWAHSGGEAHMAGEDMGQAISICLAVLQGGFGLIAGVLALLAIRRARPPRSIVPNGRPLLAADARLLAPTRPRAGPPLLQVFRS